jgi:hypothetical protein
MIGGVSIRIVREPIGLDELQRLAAGQFGDFVKAVVDVRQGVMTIGEAAERVEFALARYFLAFAVAARSRPRAVAGDAEPRTETRPGPPRGAAPAEHGEVGPEDES